MQYLKYPLIGIFIGLILGAFFGLIFDSFYTKKGQLGEKQKIQVIVFGGVGAVVGFIIGSKLATEEKAEKRKELEYQNSLISQKCLKCNTDFEYSDLEFRNKVYCNLCIIIMGEEYVAKLKEITKLFTGIDTLKRKSAIANRLEKISSITNELMIYEDVDLKFVTKKPTEILEMVSFYQKKLIK